MNNSILMDTMNMSQIIVHVYTKDSQVRISKFVKIVFILANSADPDEMQHIAAFHLGLHYLQKYPFGECVQILYISFKVVYLSKALTCMKFFLYKQKMLFFIKETDTFGHIVV